MNKKVGHCLNCGRFINLIVWTCISCLEKLNDCDMYSYKDIPNYIPEEQEDKYVRNRYRKYKKEL